MIATKSERIFPPFTRISPPYMDWPFALVKFIRSKTMERTNELLFPLLWILIPALQRSKSSVRSPPVWTARHPVGASHHCLSQTVIGAVIGWIVRQLARCLSQLSQRWCERSIRRRRRRRRRAGFVGRRSRRLSHRPCTTWISPVPEGSCPAYHEYLGHSSHVTSARGKK